MNDQFQFERRTLLQVGAVAAALTAVGGGSLLRPQRAAAEPGGAGTQAAGAHKTASTFYTKEKVASARANIEAFPWAKKQRDDAVAKAAPFLALGDEQLWNLVTAQSVKRSLGVLIRYRQRIKGSPGPDGAEINKHGNYPWIVDPFKAPWKLESPVTGEQYPSNDFASFYATGLDEHGIFDRDLALKNGQQFLVNELYPERGEGWGVDDGMGWTDPDGDTWTFVAYYNHWAVWCAGGGQATYGFLIRGVDALRDAYLFTGDTAYAHKALVLLDRIADVYPDMDCTDSRWEDGFDNGDPDINTGQGGVVNDIWECGLLGALVRCYDACYDAIEADTELLTFAQSQAKKYQLATPKSTPADMRKHLEDSIVRQVYPSVQTSKVRGNTGMHQGVLALAAVVIDEQDTSDEWLHFVFQPGDMKKIIDPDAPYGRRYVVTGGNMAPVMIEQIDRDGWGFEGAPGYCALWLGNFLNLAKALEGFQRYPDYDLFENIKFLKMFTGLQNLITLGAYVPSIGDSGQTGKPVLTGSVDVDLVGFERTRDPELGQLIQHRNGGTLDGLRFDIFSKDPQQVLGEIEKIIADQGPFDPGDRHQTGFGFSALRSGQGDAARALWMYYGRSIWHGHRDTLNIGLYGAGLDLTPDLGYPEVTGLDPERQNWTAGTISHNTVVVDAQAQATQWVGLPNLIGATPEVSLVSVRAPKVYPQVKTYERTLLMIDIDDDHSYAVDFFRVDGGADHLYSFHGAEAAVITEGLALTDQEGGSYAGPDVPFQDPDYDETGPANGYNYLDAVQRDESPKAGFAVEWDVIDTYEVNNPQRDARVRLTMLNEIDDVALADGVPPRNKPGNPERLRYLLAHRAGTDLQTVFTAVIESYDGKPVVVDRRSVDVRTEDGETAPSMDVSAVRIQLADGRVDYVISAQDPSVTYTIDQKVIFSGRAGMIRLADDVPEVGFLHDGSLLQVAEVRLPAVPGALSGKVTGFTQQVQQHNELSVQLDEGGADGDIDLAALVGCFVHVEGDEERNASYLIQGVTAGADGQCRIDLGDQTPIRGLVDAATDLNEFTFDVKVGAGLRIPLTWRRRPLAPASLDPVDHALAEGVAADQINPRSGRRWTRLLGEIRQQLEQHQQDPVVAGMGALRQQVEREAAGSQLRAAVVAWFGAALV